ncbi:MAG: four helix bundle protein [Acidobacteria bacterium]|nr:four helix bundle protein [Acidobacteriota bacterium]
MSFRPSKQPSRRSSRARSKSRTRCSNNSFCSWFLVLCTLLLFIRESRRLGAVRTNFENLQVYRLAENLADEVWCIVGTWESFARDTVGKQLVRAVDSVGANIAEGSGRGAQKDNQRFIRIARGSLNETQHWLRRAFKRKLLSAEQINTLKAILDELAPRLNAYLRSIPHTSIEPLAKNKAQRTKYKTQDA